ncbi:MAG TPA: OsmC family protein [Tepidisphaeraceae bacterium]|nr:OsmC family protein [Tepidisphaeraceae bacterium]
MVQSSVEYQGQLHCNITHGPSGVSISTDAPKDNMGKGESFSPTDLVGAALASCIITTMAIVARRHNLELSGVTATVQKEMIADPQRRIGRLPVEIRIPMQLDPEMKKRLENAAHACPVKKSLHPLIEAPIIFHWA